ncbi:MAG: hypothetical protein QN140_07475 [Armatimonadota bacterium]|nr:hypothetical protein [Armatimonadota bacterium]
MLDWEEQVVKQLPREYRFDPTGVATAAFDGGAVTVYHDWPHVNEGEPGLVILAVRSDGREEQWTPDSPEEFWRYLAEAEEYVGAEKVDYLAEYAD